MSFAEKLSIVVNTKEKYIRKMQYTTLIPGIYIGCLIPSIRALILGIRQLIYYSFYWHFKIFCEST